MKNVLITGATGGIGSATARLFAKKGYNVIVHYFKNEEQAKMLEKETGGLSFQADLRNWDATRQMFKKINEKFEKVDVLINNAGSQLIKMLCDTDRNEWKDILDLNLTAAYNTTKCALETMMWSGGKIINVSSVWGQCGGACEVAYSSAKAGVIGLTKAMAKEYGNICTNCICPGVINTKMNDHLSSEDAEELKKQIPLGRFGEPEEVAQLALFLASDKADYITGQIIAVNGGMYI